MSEAFKGKEAGRQIRESTRAREIGIETSSTYPEDVLSFSSSHLPQDLLENLSSLNLLGGCRPLRGIDSLEKSVSRVVWRTNEREVREEEDE